MMEKFDKTKTKMPRHVVKPILDNFRNLDVKKNEKFHPDTPPDEAEQSDHYLANSCPSKFGPISESAAMVGNVFVNYAYGDAKPKMPVKNEHGNEIQDFHFENTECCAFLGIGKQDMAHMWHMLVIPKIIDGANPIRWVFDLDPSHLPLLHKMRKSALQYISINRSYFMEKYPNLAHKWLMPQRIKIGFHTVPSVAYLHMHILVGPITAYGNECADKWIPFEKVNEWLLQGKDMNVLLNSYRI
jgi:hypothetical protein